MVQTLSPMLAVAASPAFLAKGCVNVLELDALKDSSGERWPRIRDGVYARLEMLLRAKLGPNDLFFRLGDTAYLVTMPTTEADDVSAICTRVAFDLHNSFLGECGLSQIHVDVVVGGEDDGLILKRLPPKTIAELAERAGIADLLPKNDGVEQYGVVLRDKALGREQGQEKEHNHRRHRASHRRQASNEIQPIETEHQFVPVWSVPNAAVTTYTCEPKSIRIASRPVNVATTLLEPRERMVVEMSALHRSLAQLALAHESGNRFLLNMPLSFDMFGSPMGRMEVLSACREMSREYRSFITYVIGNVPLGVGLTALANMVTSLNPFGRGVAATIHPATRAFSGYQGVGLKAVGYNLAEFQSRAPFGSDDAERLAQFARRNNLGTFLHGVRDKSTLKFAQDAGIQYLCGPAVAPPTEEPRGMWRLSWGEVLAKPEVEIWD